MRKKQEQKVFHFSGLQAYFHDFITERVNMEHARHKQHNVRVGDKEYKSVAAAFAALGLPMWKHQAFRKLLKAQKRAEFEGHVFEIV